MKKRQFGRLYWLQWPRDFIRKYTRFFKALLIEYNDGAETGVLNIESDADNMARQRIPITRNLSAHTTNTHWESVQQGKNPKKKLQTLQAQ